MILYKSADGKSWAEVTTYAKPPAAPVSAEPTPINPILQTSPMVVKMDPNNRNVGGLESPLMQATLRIKAEPSLLEKEKLIKLYLDAGHIVEDDLYKYGIRKKSDQPASSSPLGNPFVVAPQKGVRN
jgi:hypothetical protein